MKVLGIPVITDPTFRGHARAAGVWPFKRIVVGPALATLPTAEREAVLMHEAHHCRAFHLEARLLMLPLVLVAHFVMRVCRRQELTADRHAVRRGLGEHMRNYLARHDHPESHFYPSTAERVAEIDRLLKEEPCANT